MGRIESEVSWHWLEHQPGQDLQVLERLADDAQWFSPQVGLDRSESPDGLFLDVTGVSRLFGGEASLAYQMLVWLGGKGYWPRLVVADTLPRVWGLCRYAPLTYWTPSCGRQTSTSESEPETESEPDGLSESSGGGSFFGGGVGGLAGDRGMSGGVSWGPRFTEGGGGDGGSHGKGLSGGMTDAWLERVQRDLVKQELAWRELIGHELTGRELTGCEEAESLSAGAGEVEREEVERGAFHLPAPLLVSVGERSIWDALPVEALRLPAGTCEVLRQLGVTRVGQVGCLPRDGLATRLGAEVVRRWDQAEGEAEAVLVGFRGEPEFHVRIDLEYPVTSHEGLEHWLGEALRRLLVQLAPRRLGLLRLDVVLHASGQPPVRWRLELFRPVAQADHLFSLLRLQWERQRLPKLLEGVELQAVLTSSLETRQMELFDSRLHDQRSVDGLIDRLSSRLGAECVVEARSRYGAQPEAGFRVVAWGGRRPGEAQERRGRRKRSGSKTSSRAVTSDSVTSDSAIGNPAGWQQPLWRPTRLFSPPVCLETGDEFELGVPKRLRWEGVWRRVVQRWGPERIETGWWRGPWVRRDYYRVVLETGQRLWVFRDRSQAGWYLHGDF